MARLGWYLVVFGAGSALLGLFDREFVILGWIETWGSSAAWMIRGGMIGLGALLMLATVRQTGTLPTSSHRSS